MANVSDNTVSLVDLTQTNATLTIPGLTLPQGVAFDPVSADFLVSSSLGNSVDIVDPLAQTSTFVRVGINPTSMAYNFASSTLVTMNNVSNTMTVVDSADSTGACGFAGGLFDAVWRGHSSAYEYGCGGGFDQQPRLALASAALGQRLELGNRAVHTDATARLASE